MQRTTMTTTALVAMAAALVAMTSGWPNYAHPCDMQTKFEASSIVIGGNISSITPSRALNGGYDVTIDVFCIYKGEPTEPRITVHNVGMMESSLVCDLKPSTTQAKLTQRAGPKIIYFADTPDPTIKYVPDDHSNEYFDEISLSCGVHSPSKLPIGVQGYEIQCFEKPDDPDYADVCYKADGEEVDIVNYEAEVEAKKEASKPEQTTPKPEMETPKPEPETAKPESMTQAPTAAPTKATEAEKKATTASTPAATSGKEAGYEIKDKGEEDKQEPEPEVGATMDKGGNNSASTASLALATVSLAVLAALIL